MFFEAGFPIILSLLPVLAPLREVKQLSPMLCLPFRMLGNSACLSSDDLFSKLIFQNTIRLLNSLDPDLGGHSVGTDLCTNFLQN